MNRRKKQRLVAAIACGCLIALIVGALLTLLQLRKSERVGVVAIQGDSGIYIEEGHLELRPTGAWHDWLGGDFDANVVGIVAHSTAGTDFSVLSRFSNLESLYLDIQEGEPDLSSLRRLTNLRMLAVRKPSANVLEIASQLPKLEDLSIRYSQISDLGPIRNLANLREVDIQDAPLVRNIEPLANLPRLRVLFLIRTDVRSIAPLANHPNLGKLNLLESPVTDFSAIASIPTLKDLTLPDETKMSGEVPIAAWARDAIAGHREACD